MNRYLLVLLLAVFCKGEIPIAERNPFCKARNAYYSIDGNCDAYIECKDWAAHEVSCPDGLHYNPASRWPDYPCAYPMEVTCEGRATTQKPQSTVDCPHQYGFFSSPLWSPSRCGHYRMCAKGIAIDMVCPTGLAFNPATARCDWPDLVPSCNTEDYLQFKCPERPRGVDGNFLNVPLNYKIEGNCYSFFSCEQGQPRMLTCDLGYSFDSFSGRCEDDEKVQCVEQTSQK